MPILLRWVCLWGVSSRSWLQMHFSPGNCIPGICLWPRIGCMQPEKSCHTGPWHRVPQEHFQGHNKQASFAHRRSRLCHPTQMCSLVSSPYPFVFARFVPVVSSQLRAAVQSTADWVASKRQPSISHNSGGWTSSIMVPARSSSGDGPLSGCRWLSSQWILNGRKNARVPPEVSFTGAKTPTMKVLVLPSQWGVRVQHMNVRANTSGPLKFQTTFSLQGDWFGPCVLTRCVPLFLCSEGPFDHSSVPIAMVAS